MVTVESAAAVSPTGVTERIFLLLLFPCALTLVWGIRKLKFTDVAMIGLGLATVYVVWGILYASFFLEIFSPEPESAFDSVEYIMRDVEAGWLARYFAQSYGWVAGLAFFWVCWGIARLVERRAVESRT
jgi:quinol-cytochrome oxidoreductase complex cytochrome b subunit